jgi:hypothetical protein
MKKGFFLLITIFTIYLVYGQNSDSIVISSTTKNKPKEDTNFIQSYKKYFTIGAFSATPENEIEFTSHKKFTSTATTLKANLANTLGFTLGYRNIYLAVGFKTPFSLASKSQFGQTSYDALSLKVQNPRYLLSFDYRGIQGYYNAFPITENNQSIYIQRGDIGTQQYILSGIFNLNWKKFSYLASLIHTERQLKSKVGLLLKSSLSYNSITSDSTLVKNTELISKVKTVYDVATMNYLSTKIGPGIGLNLILFKRIYLSSMAFYCFDIVGYQYFTHTGTEIISSASVTGFAEARAALGYQSRRFYMGLKFFGDRVTFHTTQNQITTHFATVTVDIGYRLNAPGFLKKGYDATLHRFLGL